MDDEAERIRTGTMECGACGQEIAIYNGTADNPDCGELGPHDCPLVCSVCGHEPCPCCGTFCDVVVDRETCELCACVEAGCKWVRKEGR